MANTRRNTASESGSKNRNVLFVVLAIGLFLLKRQYSGPLQDVIHSYAGNISVSFALYFVFINPLMHRRAKRVLATLLVLVLVESFEAFNGFGITANTYDPLDFIANAVGAGCALGLDTILSRMSSRDVNARPAS